MAEVEVVTFIAKFALGFITDKLRDCATKKLQDGGLADEKFKGYIIRELNEINSKLDGISRRELSSSISCLEQGVLRLYMSFESGKTDAGASSAETKPAETTITVDDALTLANTIGKLKINSSDIFEKAREIFKQAGIEARRAFHNTALSIEERILANKVRMASALLENLDHPEVAASDCLLFLKELHAMPAIQEIFSVHFEGGIKSRIKSYFKKDSRMEAVKAVTMMNLILSDFITKSTKPRMAVLDWPMIYCDGLVVHPIHYDEDCFNKMKKMKITPPWDFDLLQKMLQRIAKLRGANASNSRIKSTLCCVPYPDDIERRGLLKLQMPVVSDIRQLRLSPVNLSFSAHCVAVDEDDYVCILKVMSGFCRYSAQIYTGDGSLLDDFRLKVPFPQRLLFLVNFPVIKSCHLGIDEDDGNVIYFVVVDLNLSGITGLANLYDDDGDRAVTGGWSAGKYILHSKYKTISIPLEHFFPFFTVSPIDVISQEVAFVYTRGYHLKGIVRLYPNCTDSSSSSSLWDRYLPSMHVTADGKTLRCLHSKENLKDLFSRGF